MANCAYAYIADYKRPAYPDWEYLTFGDHPFVEAVPCGFRPDLSSYDRWTAYKAERARLLAAAVAAAGGLDDGSSSVRSELSDDGVEWADESGTTAPLAAAASGPVTGPVPNEAERAAAPAASEPKFSEVRTSLICIMCVPGIVVVCCIDPDDASWMALIPTPHTHPTRPPYEQAVMARVEALAERVAVLEAKAKAAEAKAEAATAKLAAVLALAPLPSPGDVAFVPAPAAAEVLAPEAAEELQLSVFAGGSRFFFPEPSSTSSSSSSGRVPLTEREMEVHDGVVARCSCVRCWSRACVRDPGWPRLISLSYAHTHTLFLELGGHPRREHCARAAGPHHRGPGVRQHERIRESHHSSRSGPGPRHPGELGLASVEGGLLGRSQDDVLNRPTFPTAIHRGTFGRRTMTPSSSS